MICRVGIAGYNGYSGAELVRILQHHGSVDAVLLDHRQDAAGLGSIHNKPGPEHLPCTPVAVKSAGLALVFLATPPEVSMELAPEMLAAGARVVDLSGAFRLRTPANYTAWYGAEHTRPE